MDWFAFCTFVLFVEIALYYTKYLISYLLSKFSCLFFAIADDPEVTLAFFVEDYSIVLLLLQPLTV